MGDLRRGGWMIGNKLRMFHSISQKIIIDACAPFLGNVIKLFCP
jgi:hypothetical protein